MYMLLIICFSAVFNGVADRSLRAQIDEEAIQILRTSGNMDSQAYEQLRLETRRGLIVRYHLEEPWFSRVLWRALDILLFRFGNSTTIRSSGGDRRVAAILMEAIPNTLLLFGIEALLVMALGTAVGLHSATHKGKLLDKSLAFLPMLLKGLPSWWIGMLAIMAFSYTFPWFPSGGKHVNPIPKGFGGFADLLWHLVLPVVVLVVLNLWGFALEVRNLIADLVDSMWITAARGRGIPERSILYRHVLAGARAPLFTLVVMGLLQSLSGNLLIEGIFGWPGLGNLYFVAVQQSDIPVLMGVMAFQTFLNLVGYVGLDLAYRALDPRVRSRDLA